MSNEHKTTEDDVIGRKEIDPRGLAGAISDGRRDFTKIILKSPESFGSYVDSTIGVINKYTLKNLNDLKSRPIKFSRASLKGFYAPGIVLPYTIFDYADLQGADLSGADLRHARFVRTNARQIDFDRATLNGAIFKGSDLREFSPWTDLSDVVFEGGNWDGADFTRARNVDRIKLWKLPASYDGMVVTPEQAAYFESIGFSGDKFRVKS
ncbi:MAG: pentapeptide repeat-containing protein [Nanoarchaeota archaeon]